jgi:hypothetical protein
MLDSVTEGQSNLDQILASIDASWHHAAGTGVAAHGGHDDLVRTREDLAAHVVDGLDVAPRLHRRVWCRFDHVEVDAVGEHLATPQHQDSCVVGGRVPQRKGESAALPGGHRTVVEVERHHPDVAHACVGDLLPSRPRSGGLDRGQRRRCDGQPISEGDGGGKLHAQLAVKTNAADLTDPDPAVARANQHGPVALESDRARLTGTRRDWVRDLMARKE